MGDILATMSPQLNQVGFGNIFGLFKVCSLWLEFEPLENTIFLTLPTYERFPYVYKK